MMEITATTMRVVTLLYCGFLIMMYIRQSMGSRADVIMTLSEKINEEQIKQNQEYENITHLEEIEGIYRNYIHLNLHGTERNAVIRHDIGLPDNNPFISGIVGLQVLDAFRFGQTPKPPEEEIEKIVKVYKDSHEMNADHDTSLMLFFLQRYNPETDFWQTYPTNIIRIFQTVSRLPIPYTIFLDALLGSADNNMPAGLANLFSAKQISDRMRIPADFDSSSTHLCFGSILYQLRDQYPDAWSAWINVNRNLTSIFDALKKYAYRPFSNDLNANTIDTRSYFFMRGFLDKAKKDGKEVAIIPTWAQNIDEQRIQYQKGIAMPWGVNIIDMTVIANFLAGIFSAVDMGLIHPDVINQDVDLNLILDSSASLMIYFLQHNLTRPDLALAYYPSVNEFYWFVARGLMYMENAKQKGSLKDLPVYEKYYYELSRVMRTTITQRILLSAKKSEKDGTMFYDDFLGNSDLSYNGKPINRAEDRYFTTAMAVNSLIYTWSVYDERMESIRWKDCVPEVVKGVVVKVSKWLESNSLGGKLGVRNAFFSVSEKNRETIPLWYPANRFEYLDGTRIGNFNRIPEELTIFGMEGYVEPDDYQKLLEVNQFGVPTQLTFEGFNTGQGAVIFWSCEAISYAGAMLTLSMTDVLEAYG